MNPAKDQDNSFNITNAKEKGVLLDSKLAKEKYPDLVKLPNGFFNKTIVYEGDLHVNGNLDLNASNGMVIMILGNLHVTGSISNDCGDTGDHLLVLKNTKAKNILAGGSFIYLNGNADIEELIYPFHNNGSLFINELTNGVLLDNDEHSIEIIDFSKAKAVFSIFKYAQRTEYNNVLPFGVICKIVRDITPEIDDAYIEKYYSDDEEALDFCLELETEIINNKNKMSLLITELNKYINETS